MFTLNQFRPLLLILPVCASLLAITAHAQTDKPCKPQVRANRGKILVYESLETSQSEWNMGDGIYVIQAGDSVHVQKNGVTITRFNSKGGRITDSRYEEFYTSGRLKRVDSLSTKGYGYWHEETYFEVANAFVVNTRTYYPDGIPQTLRYYRRFDGTDSLRRTWHPNGALQQTVWAYPSGTDSAVWHWNHEGILYGKQYEGHSINFYPTGTLQSTFVDTIINEQPLTCSKAYHPNGTLRSVEYEWQGIPYLTWLYYNQEGVLTKRIPHTPPTTHEGWIPEVVVEEPPMLFFAIVDELPAFPGGEQNLKKYITEKLAHVACDSPLPLQNKYEVQFTINTEGRVLFQSIKGENADGITPAMRQLINTMPRWKPGKRAGRPMNVMYVMMLGIDTIL